MKLSDIREIKLTRKQRFITLFCGTVLILAVGHWIGGGESAPVAVSEAPPEEMHTDTLPSRPYFKTPLVSYKNEFNDLNDVQLIAAQANGLKTPIRGREEAERLVDQGGLVYIGASPFFYMDELTHSIPYLVPKAHKLLTRISVNFIDSLQHRGIPLHMPIVTSVLRTEEDITSLQRRNQNASSQSCHRYGTTFDISYNRFKEIGADPQGDHHDYNRQILMKRTLGEVLRDLRYEGRCYVKHEVKQGCFHVTVR